MQTALFSECWSRIARADVPRGAAQVANMRHLHQGNARRLVTGTVKEARKRYVKRSRAWKGVPDRGKKLGREVKNYFRRYDRDVADHDRRRARERDEKTRLFFCF